MEKKGKEKEKEKRNLMLDGERTHEKKKQVRQEANDDKQ